MKKLLPIILIAVSSVFIQGCDNPIVKSIMKKMPWYKEEKVEKSESEILKEQLQVLEDQVKEKEAELASIKTEKKISDRVNKIDTLRERWKCRLCGQLTTVRPGADPNNKKKCFYCNSYQYSKVEFGGPTNKEEAWSKNRRAVDINKEIQDLNIKIASMKDMIKVLEKKGK